MTVNKRSKHSRQRGRNSHGYGAKKKHRGAGHRGGRGMAGSGKRADQKKPTILKLYGNEYFGKKGFHRPQQMLREIRAINLADLELHLEKYVAEKLIDVKGDEYAVDLSKLGYDKLLGKGSVSHKFKITVEFVSEKAQERVIKAGGAILHHGSAE